MDGGRSDHQRRTLLDVASTPGKAWQRTCGHIQIFQVLFLTDLLWEVSKKCCKVLAVSSKAARPSLVEELHLHICNSYWRYESWLSWPFANISALVYMTYLGLFFITMLTSKWLQLEGEVCFANLTPLPSVHANHCVYLVALGGWMMSHS